MIPHCGILCQAKSNDDHFTLINTTPYDLLQVRYCRPKIVDLGQDPAWSDFFNKNKNLWKRNNMSDVVDFSYRTLLLLKPTRNHQLIQTVLLACRQLKNTTQAYLLHIDVNINSVLSQEGGFQELVPILTIYVRLQILCRLSPGPYDNIPSWYLSNYLLYLCVQKRMLKPHLLAHLIGQGRCHFYYIQQKQGFRFRRLIDNSRGWALQLWCGRNLSA